MIIHSFSHRKWNIINLAGNAIVLLALFWLSAVPSMAGPVPPSDEEVSNTDAGSPFPLVELPAHALHRLSTHLSSEDTRSLVSTSRTVQEAIASLNADKLKFRGTNDLASVQLCLETCNFPCLEFWTPLLSETFRQEQLLSIRVLGEVTSQNCGCAKAVSSFMKHIDSLLATHARLAFWLISKQLFMHDALKKDLELKFANLNSDIDQPEYNARRIFIASNTLSKYLIVVKKLLKSMKMMLDTHKKAKLPYFQFLWDLLGVEGGNLHGLSEELGRFRNELDPSLITESFERSLAYWTSCSAEHRDKFSAYIDAMIIRFYREPVRSEYDPAFIQSVAQINLNDPLCLLMLFSGHLYPDVLDVLWIFLILHRRVHELRYFLCELGLFRRAKESLQYYRVWVILGETGPNDNNDPSVREKLDLEIIQIVHENMEKYPELMDNAKAHGNAAIVSFLQSG